MFTQQHKKPTRRGKVKMKELTHKMPSYKIPSARVNLHYLNSDLSSSTLHKVFHNSIGYTNSYTEHINVQCNNSFDPLSLDPTPDTASEVVGVCEQAEEGQASMDTEPDTNSVPSPGSDALVIDDDIFLHDLLNTPTTPLEHSTPPQTHTPTKSPAHRINSQAFTQIIPARSLLSEINIDASNVDIKRVANANTPQATSKSPPAHETITTSPEHATTDSVTPATSNTQTHTHETTSNTNTQSFIPTTPSNTQAANINTTHTLTITKQ